MSSDGMPDLDLALPAAPEAMAMPLSHGIWPRPEWARPGTEIVPSSTKPFTEDARVCFYLGPLRRRTTKPSMVGLLFDPAVEGDDWYAFPCDAGGTGRTSEQLESVKLANGRWRGYLDLFVQRSFEGDWNGFIQGETPDLSWLPKPLETFVGPRRSGADPAGWTPEVCSPRAVPLTSHVIAACIVPSLLANAANIFGDVGRLAHAYVTQLEEICGVAVEVPRSTTEVLSSSGVLVQWSEDAVTRRVGGMVVD